MTTYTGHVLNGAIVFDGPPPPDGAAVRIEVVANGVAKAVPAVPPARATLTLTPEEEAVIPPDIAELLKTNPAGLNARALDVIRLSWVENPDEVTPDDPLILPQGQLNLTEDASAQIDHYLYGAPKR